MMYTIKLGEDTNYEDYQEMIENHELDDIIPVAKSVVDQFMQRFPGVLIDEVQLVVNKTGTITTDIKEIVMENKHEDRKTHS